MPPKTPHKSCPEDRVATRNVNVTGMARPASEATLRNGNSAKSRNGGLPPEFFTDLPHDIPVSETELAILEAFLPELIEAMMLSTEPDS